MKKILSLIIMLSFLSLPSCEEGGADVYTASCIAMDTSCTVTVYGKNAENAADKCTELLLNMEAELSVTLSGSLLCALNTYGSADGGEYLARVAEKAIELKELTNGAYEPCIYSLVKLWGFTGDSYSVPSEDEIAAAVELVRSSSLSVSDGVVYRDGALVDFGGIAKGYAAEVLADSLWDAGVEAAVISLGGNIKTLGTKPDGTPWNIGISAPSGGGKLLGVLEVGECAVVTSGSYIRNFTVDGKLYHHIIDPSDGYPTDNGLVSVTVVCDSADLADGLATAFFVLGREKATELATKLGAETVFVTSDCIYVSDGLKEKFTPDETARGEYDIIYG